jgi:Uma2 family endonuclease
MSVLDIGIGRCQERWKRIPADSSIYRVDTRVPALVLEVGNTQSAKDLKEKANAYVRTGGARFLMSLL